MHVLLSSIGNLTTPGNLTDEQCKWILKQYWKTENSELIRKQWIETFLTPPPTRLFYYCIPTFTHPCIVKKLRIFYR